MQQQGALNVNRTFLSSAVAAVLIAIGIAGTGLSARLAHAQAPAGAQAPGPIALVDVNYIFKKHVRLKSQLQELQEEAKKVQEGFEQQMQQLNQEVKNLENFKPGTPDYTHMEEALVSKKAQLQGMIALKRKEFVQKEAHVYYTAYQEISDETKYQCEQRGIILVLNFNGDRVNEANPDDVARGISNKVVYYNKNLDITPLVLQRFLTNAPAHPAVGGPTANTGLPFK